MDTHMGDTATEHGSSHPDHSLASLSAKDEAPRVVLGAGVPGQRYRGAAGCPGCRWLPARSERSLPTRRVTPRPRPGLRPTAGVRLTWIRTARERPRSGRVRAVRRQVASGHDGTQQEQTSRSERVSRPTTAGPLTRSGEVRLLAVCDLSHKQRNQFASHRPDEHHHIQHQPPSLPRCSVGLRLLARHPSPYNRRRVSGRWWISCSRHAAQVRHRPSGARQPARARRTKTRAPCWANAHRRPS